MDKIDELLTRGIANIIPDKNQLKTKLANGRKLNIYFGIDPTATKIHLGHAVSLRKLQKFALEGHNVTFLIGDFTALIGDTSDKDTQRPVLTPEEIRVNFRTYKKQAEKILDFSKIIVRYNSEWLSKLFYADIIKLSQMFSLNDFISRELIRKRLDEGKKVALHEVQYPLMQGYDSYILDTDIQIGGTDQTFNMQAGRTLLKNWKNKESFILTTPILEGIDGRKMSKTWGNAIWLDDTPEDMYAKIMAINDDLLLNYFTLATNILNEEIEKIVIRLKNKENPMLIKKELAKIIVIELHDKKAAVKAAENFEKTVQQKEIPQEIPEITLEQTDFERTTLLDLLVKLLLVDSKSEAKRLVEQGGVTINNEVLIDPKTLVVYQDNMLVRVGKRKFVKVQIKE